MKCRLATPSKHSHLQLKSGQQPLQRRGEKATTSNFELWNHRPFPECPLPFRPPKNQVTPRTVWTGDMPEAWLEEPDIPE